MVSLCIISSSSNNTARLGFTHAFKASYHVLRKQKINRF